MGEGGGKGGEGGGGEISDLPILLKAVDQVRSEDA